MQYDLKIEDGFIVDGTGAPGYAGDVGIRDGRIVALGSAPGQAGTVIEAKGQVIAPGVVDIHTHYDAQLLWDRKLTISPWHGVTTVVIGNCGFGIAPTRREHHGLILRTLENVEGMSVTALEAGLGENWGFETFPQYLDTVERRGTVINVAALLGHTPLRLFVMGEEATERAARPEEVAAMKRIMREGLEAGALGFATSKSRTHVGYEGRPVPSRLAEFNEILEIASALGDAGAGVIQATVGKELSFDEFAELNRRTGRNVSWTALLSGGGVLNVGSVAEQLARSAELHAAGHAVFPQVSGRPLNFEFRFDQPFLFQNMPVFAPINKADHAGRRALYADASFREQFRQALRGPRLASWENAVIAHCPSDPALDERRLIDVARERGSNTIDTALDACSAAVLDTQSTRLIAHESQPMQRGHAEALMPLLARVMKHAAMAFAALDRIAVTTGPGSFTGLRVGISAARGIALAAGKPIVGLTTLTAFAAPYVSESGAHPIMSVIDARHDHVYLQVASGNG
ncbi:MAG: tRNA (adenosine(37)-N6)-threonylcarbamoyltransferase complex dimerization subunit type 1 TsaB, partial [Rhodospirillales bacterium]|nr:tRNA (adenosine(37)-N6)-threonylcarbamoyltransferase complex dimerization subunit type 1 TsaB [Rhodospirillales bacterium]